MTISDEQLAQLVDRFNKSIAYAGEDNINVMDALVELLELRKRCAELEAERDAWRKDAEKCQRFMEHRPTCIIRNPNTHWSKAFNNTAGKCNCGCSQAWRDHDALVAKYPADPAKNDEWTAEDILRREG